MCPVSDEELKDWMASLDDFISAHPPTSVAALLKTLDHHARQRGLAIPFVTQTPYLNTIPKLAEPAFPGDAELEWRIRSLIRWNAMAMVVRANRASEGIGGHISTFASAATLYDIGFNHFFRGRQAGADRDLIYFQGHASPGIYARAFLEGRLSEAELINFRQEIGGRGLSSYPHPWLMPDFWEFPTVSMGLGPIMAIYQARFMRYLEDRGLKSRSTAKVWAFIGDGEVDEPETLGSLTLAAREQLDNLIFVINCNLQRLDGPVRGNGKIIQELESVFRGAGWNVIKLIWGADWDHLLEKDDEGLLVERMGKALDGDYQKYSVEPGSYTREHFFGTHPKLKEMVAQMSDEQIRRLRRGGHDPIKVYAAYRAAVAHRGQPTVILAKTIKGYGLGESGEGKNISHQQKKLNEEELRAFRTRFGIPITDEDVAKAPFYKPADQAPEMIYLQDRRKKLGGAVPARSTENPPLKMPEANLFDEFAEGTAGRAVSTTMAFVRILAKLLKTPQIGRYLVPIVADEARTFGMEALFRQCGIYSHLGQLYEPVDKSSLLYYKEAKDGQILEEGITEAGALCSFIAAGTSYATYGIPMVPFFTFYSMFGLQRVGDLIWAAADMRARGFLVGATAGRTTLAGEGLQHQDGHSHLSALAYPNLIGYDPCYAYEIAAIIRHGLKRMYQDGEAVFYYLTVGNENYPQAQQPQGTESGILQGLYLLREGRIKKTRARAQLIGSGALLIQVLRAADYLEAEHGIACSVWSATSYRELYQDGIACDRYNRLHVDKPRQSYVAQCFEGRGDVFVFVSDYVRALMHSIFPWVPGPAVALGTDGFGRSDSRERLRAHFEVDYRFTALATLERLHTQGLIPMESIKQTLRQLELE